MRYSLMSLKLALPVVLLAAMLLGAADRASAQSGPCLAVIPDTLSFHGNICGEYLTPAESDSQYVVIYNCGDSVLEWTVSYYQSWVRAMPDSGLGSDSVAVWIDWGYLPDFFPPPLPGDTIVLEATLTVTALGAIDSPQHVTVLLSLYCEPDQRYLAVQPLRFDLNVAVGDTLSRDFFVFETHGDSIEFWYTNNSSWLSLPWTFAPLYTPHTCYFLVSTEGLAPGTYYDTVFLQSTEAANSPVKLPVTLTVTGGASTIQVAPSSLRFGLLPGELAFDSLYVFDTQGRNIPFHFGNSEPWLVVTPMPEPPYVTPMSLTVMVTAAELAPGVYSDSLFIFPDTEGTSFPPVIVPVNLTVRNPMPVVRTRPERFDFFLYSGDTLRDQALFVYEENGAALPFHFETVFVSEWLQIRPPDSPMTWPYMMPNSLYLDIPTGDLTPGVYADTIIIYNPMDDSLWYEDVRVPVTLAIAGEPGPYVVETRPTEFHFMLTEDEVTYDSLFVYEIHDHHVGFLFSNHSSWFTLDPFGMPPYATPTSLTMIVHSDSLPPGRYVDTIFILPAFGPPFTEVAVPVTLTVRHDLPVVKASPDRFDFSLSPGDSLLKQGMLVYEESGSVVPFFVETILGSEWLRIQYPLTLNIPVTPDSVLFDIYSGSLAPGVYADTIVIYNPMDDTLWYDEVKVPVELTIEGEPPACEVVTDPRTLDFILPSGESTYDSLYVYEVHGRSVLFHFSEHSSWLAVYAVYSPMIMTPAPLMVLVNTDSLPPGLYVDSIFIFPDTDGVKFPVVAVPVVLSVDTLPRFVCGDIDNDGQGPDISDLVYFIQFMFGYGLPPSVLASADVNGSGGPIDIADLVYLIDYMFRAGDALTCSEHPGG